VSNNTPVLATIETDDDLYIGVIVPIDNYTFMVQTGLRGRPVILHMSQVVEVLPVDKHNPHVEK
jgi:hypothetical protein